MKKGIITVATVVAGITLAFATEANADTINGGTVTGSWTNPHTGQVSGYHIEGQADIVKDGDQWYQNGQKVPEPQIELDAPSKTPVVAAEQVPVENEPTVNQEPPLITEKPDPVKQTDSVPEKPVQDLEVTVQPNEPVVAEQQKPVETTPTTTQEPPLTESKPDPVKQTDEVVKPEQELEITIQPNQPVVAAEQKPVIEEPTVTQEPPLTTDKQEPVEQEHVVVIEQPKLDVPIVAEAAKPIVHEEHHNIPPKEGDKLSVIAEKPHKEVKKDAKPVDGKTTAPKAAKDEKGKRETQNTVNTKAETRKVKSDTLVENQAVATLPKTGDSDSPLVTLALQVGGGIITLAALAALAVMNLKRKD